MSQAGESDDELRREVFELADACQSGRASSDEVTRLRDLVCSHADARRWYVLFVYDSTLLRRRGSADEIAVTIEAGIDPDLLARMQQRQPGVTPAAPLIPFPAPPTPTAAPAGSPLLGLLRSSARVARKPKWLAAAAVLVAVGVLTFAFWPSGSVAKLVGTTDAKWGAASASAGEALAAGQRLVLHSGSVEIAFGSQARVILEGPADLVIVNAGACRLSNGRLTARVPGPAKGFQVHTPGSTVTDLGTEFGVYVRDEAGGNRLEAGGEGEQEQTATGGPQHDGRQQPVTEVHVFTGKVEVAQQSPTPSKSEVINHKSKMLFAGQAVTIRENIVQPLPAADPFKFAVDSLHSRTRTVLLAEDFESYDVGVKRNAIGAWIVQGGIRKGQGVGINDYDKGLADQTAGSGLPDPSLNPPPPSISRVLTFTPSERNPRSTFPRVARPIKAPQLAHTCQVLVEFVIFPSQDSIEPSFALAAEAGVAQGIEFWRNADAAAPRIPWKPNLVYRVRVLMDVAKGRLGDARVERSQWNGSAGWVRDADFRSPVPTVDWTTPPKFLIFGYPTVTPQTPATPFHVDNIRIEVISEK